MYVYALILATVTVVSAFIIIFIDLLNMVEVIEIALFVFSKGIIRKDGTINNSASIERLAEVALNYALAGKLSFRHSKPKL